MKSQQIRQTFTEYFKKKGHTIVPSSSLIPGSDPTLLFTNAGMVQFKDVFLGTDKRPYTRATTVQKCVRAGGKHNDLENVGFTARHHTFFEMLGNFSFGDYFKKEAIAFAWELLTQEFKIPAEKLWVTVYEEDDEAYDIWVREIGVSPDRISRIGAKDNFWMMGDTGPCGPCTEIFYDHGAHVPGGPPGTPEGDLDRYIEIWNLVFMQYNRASDGTMTPLPKPSVDTGAGLERLAAVLQGVHDNYDIDTFKTLIAATAKITHTQDLHTRSLRVISDHIRSTSFLIADGVTPSNEGRGYVLRRIIRRAIRHGYMLGMREPFFYKLVATLKEIMGEAYPQLVSREAHIAQALKQEEEQFLRTLSQGIRLFEEAIQGLSGKIIPGEVVFKLYDTYGFPVDLTEDMARERDLTLDIPGFETCMDAQRERARKSSKFAVDYNELKGVDYSSEFSGYLHLNQNAKVLGVHDENRIVVLDQTPFYPEGGGQVGDRGILKTATAEFVVTDTQKKNNAILHVGYFKSGEFAKDDQVEAIVDVDTRRYTRRNHSATHLLHSALQQILGSHVEQKGSLVNEEVLRFDFSHPKALTLEEKAQIERLVNEWISQDYPAEVHQMNIEEAKKMGAMALFGEKYGETVRVLKMGEVSVELCGGTHVTHTGEIGLFKIISEGAIASGIRRIEGVTSLGAKAYLDIQVIESKAKVAKLEEDLKAVQKQNEALKMEALLSELPKQLLTGKKSVKGLDLVVGEVANADGKQLTAIIEALKKDVKHGVITLASISDKTSLIVSVSPELAKTYKAGDLLNKMLAAIGGKGGGLPELAQGGGARTEDLAALWKILEDML